MTTSSEAIKTEALSLSREDRTRLIIQLLESIDERPDADPRQAEHAWLTEANQRYQAYLRGEEQAIPAEDVIW